MAAKDTTLKNINRIAETQFMIRPQIVNALKEQ